MTKKIGIAFDILMYGLMAAQLLYVFTGNNLHEILGITFFVCLVIHIVIKRRWIKALFTGKLKNAPGSQKFAAVITCLLFLSIVMMMLSSMGVSRMIFPWFKVIGSADLHRYLAASTLSLSALHGGMHFYVRTKKKKRAAVLTALAALACAAAALYGVPYINRHFRTVEVDYSEAVRGDKAEWKGTKPLIVYFTRLGNTDFEPDVDAVSGASLLLADGRLTGSDQLLADMLEDITGCEKRAVTLTGKKYSSSYGATVGEAIDEINAGARPEIEPIDISGYDSVILIYPLWWGTVPPAVSTFLEGNDFSGKTVYLIATQGSSGFSSSTEDIRTQAPGAEVVEVMSIYCDDIPKARERLLEWARTLTE